MTVRSILSGAALALLVGVTPAAAALIDVTSYDMPNGHGVAQSSFLNYWDGNYSNNTGNNFTDNAPLSGGVGALTDGIIASMRWDHPDNTNIGGTGKYVGWKNTLQPDGPEITFHFGSSQHVQELNMWVDASNNGTVGAPSFLLVNGGFYVPTVSGAVDPTCPAANNNTANCVLKLTVLGNWIGESIVVQPHHGPLPWMMISEVQFANAVPEPSTWAMMLLGFAGVAWVAYRRSRKNTATKDVAATAAV